MLAVVAVGIAVVIVPAAVDRRPAQIPLASSYQSLFHNEGKAESAQDRLNLAAEAEHLIPQHLLIGWGLGIEFPYYEAGSRTVVTIAYAHNLLLDLWLRLGLIGVVSFFIALLGSVSGGLRVWRRHRDPVTAALALAMVGVVAGLVATGFLEPLLDEYRFAVLFGVSLGILRACVTSMDVRPRSLSLERRGGGRRQPGRTDEMGLAMRQPGVVPRTPESLVGWQQPVLAGRCRSAARDYFSLRSCVEGDERSHSVSDVEIRAEGPGWI